MNVFLKWGSWVLNKQGPNKQIWLSSPFTGPRRFDYDFTSNRWVDHRDGQVFLQNVMEEELSKGLKVTIKCLNEF